MATKRRDLEPGRDEPEATDATDESLAAGLAAAAQFDELEADADDGPDDELDEEDGAEAAVLPMDISDAAASTLGQDQIQRRLSRLGVESESHRRLALVLPWIASIVIHAALLAVALVVTWAVVRLRAPEDPVLIVADFEQPTYRPVTSAGDVEGALTSAFGSAAAPAIPLPPAPAAAGPSLPMAAPTAPPSPVDWSPPSGRSVSFAGVRASNARRVVYVVDASGSMIGTLPIVLEELSRSLRALSPDQSYAIIFFQRNEALAVPPVERLAPATPDQVERSLRWIRQRVVPAGRSNPLRALESAARLRPDAIFLLSSSITGAGEFEIDAGELVARLDRVNPADASGRRRTLIQCIQFLDPDPLDTLRRIAEVHGGPDGYRFLSRAELGIAPR